MKNRDDSVNNTLLPLISIITINYNGDKYLEECIQSVVNQKYERIEYIIIDGGSTDNSVNIINKYLSYIDCFVSEKDEGISDAFNKGIAKTKGDVVGILNSDDLYAENAISIMADAYVKNGGKSGVYFGDILYFDETEKLELIARSDKLWKYMSIFHPATFITKDIYEQFGGYSKEYKYAMDCELIHRFLSQKVSFIHVDKTLANFRLGGTSDKNYKKSYQEFYKSVKTHNYSIASVFYYYWNITKKNILHTRLGKFLNKRRQLLSWVLAKKK